MEYKNSLDKQYTEILTDILENGVVSSNRTGIDTKSVFVRHLRADLSEGFPIMTMRQHSFKIAFYETMMFINGDGDTKKWLEDNGINIWKGNTSREFLDNRGLNHLPEGDIGYAYGRIWRDFDGVDQLQNIFDTLKNNPSDRRMVMSAWHPARLHEAALPPCHILSSFYVRNNKLSNQFIMRSLDYWNGTQYDLLCYSLLTSLLAHALKMEVGEVVMTSADTHLYLNGESIYNEYLGRESFELPKLKINKELNTLEDICNLKFEDVELINYKHAGKMERVPMAI